MTLFPHTLPFAVQLKNFKEDGPFLCQELLRELPGKRLVYKGSWQSRSVIIKLFLGPGRAQHDWAQEKAGVEALEKKRIATPELLFSGQLVDDTPVLVFDYLPGAETALDRWNGLPTLEARSDFLCLMVDFVCDLHLAGLVQEDLHLENLLISDETLYAIDGDAVCSKKSGTPLDLKTSSRNLALFFAQFVPEYDPFVEKGALRYAKRRNISASKLRASLKEDLPMVRRRRRRKYVSKSYRSCTEFVRSKHSGLVAISRRDAQGATLERFLAAPDDFMRQGEILKDGNTSTVTRVQVDGLDWVVKRYNIKNGWHALSRSFRPTRAWTSWGNAQRLTISGIATPRAIAVVEKRIGPLRSTGYYVSDFVAGVHAKDFFQRHAAQDHVTRQVAERFVHLFELMHQLKICHGDCKATNFLLKDNEPWVLDLDVMRECTSSAAFQRLFQVDRQRFLSNWQSQPELQQWFDNHLPGKLKVD